MRTSAPPTIALVTLPLSKVAVSAAAFTIRSTFSAKSSAAEEELAAAFLKRFLAESPAGAKIDNVGRICVTTCKSRSRKPHSAQKEIEVRKLDICDKCGGTGAESGARSIN